MININRSVKYSIFSAIFIATIALMLYQGVKEFIVNLPTSYHSLFFIFLGIWLWGINMHVLVNSKIDCTNLLNPEARPLRNSNSGFINHRNIYNLALDFTAFLCSSILLYSYCSTLWEKSTLLWIPITTLILTIYIVFMPHKAMYRRERKKFVDSFMRIIKPTIKVETPFFDNVLADLITSFSKVVGDVYVALAELFIELVVVPVADKRFGDNIITDNGKYQKDISVHLHHHILLDLFGSFMILLPYLFRLKQCIADYKTKATPSQRKKSLFNALKYATSIPVYCFSGYYSWIKSDIKNTDDKELLVSMYDHAKVIFTLWVIASFINSGYSYYWDIFNDWELGKKRTDTEEKFPIFLRPILHFSKHWTYYAVMILDLILRFTWFVDVFPIFQLKNPFLVDDTPTIPEDIIKMRIEKLLLSRLLLRLLEVMRRWLWIFFRIEKEWVYTGSDYVRIENDERNYKTINSASTSNSDYIDIINSSNY